MPKVDDYLVAIDIGSAKVGVLIGQPDGNGRVEVVGKGLAPNRGTRRGNIVNVEQTVEALKQATEEAEVMAGVDVSVSVKVTVGPRQAVPVGLPIKPHDIEILCIDTTVQIGVSQKRAEDSFH